MTSTDTEAGKPAPTAKELAKRAKWLQTALVSGKYPYGTPDYNYIHLAVAELVDGLKSLAAEPEREQGTFQEVQNLLKLAKVSVLVQCPECRALLPFIETSNLIDQISQRLSPKAGEKR